MAGKVAKALKIVAGVGAGIVAGAGVYRAGKRAGAEKAHAVKSASDTLAKNVAQPSSENMPRPGMKASPEEAPRITHDRKAYHALINERANDLRARIAEQAYASVLQEGSASDGQVQATAVEVEEGESAVQDEEPVEPDSDDADASKTDISTLAEEPASAKKATSTEESAPTEEPASDYSDEPEPYERIQDALKTTKLFD